MTHEPSLFITYRRAFEAGELACNRALQHGFKRRFRVCLGSLRAPDGGLDRGYRVFLSDATNGRLVGAL